MADLRQLVVMSGGCQCGGVRYQISGAPVALYVCHCRECRKQSASAFGISVIVRRAEFRLVQGAPKVWSRAADSGRMLECAFCPDVRLASMAQVPGCARHGERQGRLLGSGARSAPPQSTSGLRAGCRA